MKDATSNCLVVMQPTFLPWAGYFNLISRADIFVFLDNVQLEKQSWQTRNRLLLNGKSTWISLPIKHINLDQTIMETEPMQEQRWFRKTFESFHHSYKAHDHYSEALEILRLLEKCSNMKLSILNETIIVYVAEKLGIKTKFYRNSDLDSGNDRSERLTSLCAHFNAKEYLSPVGSREYLHKDGFIEKTTSKLRLQEFTPAIYNQKGTSEFISHLSIVDVVANLGWETTRKYITEEY
jgi:hypothetical protein